MSKIRIVEIFTLIKKYFVAFISICFFVILAVGLFLGMGNASDATVNSIYEYYEAQHLHDLEVILPYGITEGEIQQLEDIEGVDIVEKAPYSYEWFSIGNDRYQAKVSNVPKAVDILSLREGKLPEKAGEVAIEESWAKDHGISIGDKIIFNSNYSGETKLLTQIANYNEADVDDLVEYLSVDKDSQVLEYLTVYEYEVTAFVECPTRIVSDSAKENSILNGLPVDVKLFVSEECFQSEQFAYCNQIRILSNDLRGYSYREEAYKKKCSELKSQVQSCLNSIYAEKNRLLQENKKQIEKRGQEEIDFVEKNYSRFEKLISEAKEKLQKFTDKEIKEMDASILDREYNGNYLISETVVSMLDNMRVILSGTFIVIGLLVCFSAVSRFVSQQTKLIGTKKALGMRTGEILSTFLLFTGISVFLGCLVGVFVVGPIIQRIILSTMENTFNIASFSDGFDVIEALTITLFELFTLVVVTWITVRKKLTRTAISLLSGNEITVQKHHFYEKMKAWKRLHLFTKTIINNATTDLVRVFATIIGIAGATALIVISITIYNNLGESLKTQFSKSFHFDSVIYFEVSEEDAINEISDVLEKHQAEGTAVYWKNTPVEIQENEMTLLRVIVPENQDEFDSFVEIVDSASHNKLDTNNGLYCSYSISSWYGEKAEIIGITDNYGKKYEVNPDAFFDSYLATGFIIVDKATYAKIFGVESTPNVFLVNTKNVNDIGELKSDLNNVQGYCSISDYQLASKYAFNVVQSLVKILVIIYMFISLVMSVLIVLNLLNQHILEKKKELIVLRINGYGIKDTKRYIYTDTIIIGIISVLIGVVIGSVLGNIAMAALDSPGAFFLRRIDFIACIAGIVISGILTFTMSIISLKKIDKLKLSDISA